MKGTALQNLHGMSGSLIKKVMTQNEKCAQNTGNCVLFLVLGQP